MGAYGLDLGTFSPFLYAFREREIILDLFEEVCGARLTYSYITMGGATHDLPEMITIPPGLASLAGKRSDLTLSWLDATRLFLDWLDQPRQPNITRCSRATRSSSSGRPAWASCRRKWPRATAARARCCAAAASIGTSAATATRSTRGCTRATSSTLPVAPFAEAPPEVVVGDNWCRFYVRMLELVQAIRLVRQAMDRYPTAEGTYRVPYKMSTKLPKDEVYLETECPRGQMGFYIVGNGDAEPLRAGRRAPASATSSITGPICKDFLLGDIPAIVGSLDIVMGEIDR